VGGRRGAAPPPRARLEVYVVMEFRGGIEVF